MAATYRPQRLQTQLVLATNKAAMLLFIPGAGKKLGQCEANKVAW